jgi:hypothetical protein
MISQTPAAFGLYPSTRALYSGADALRTARFRQTDISVMYSDGVHALRVREAVEATGVADDDGYEPLGGLLSALSGIEAIVMRDHGPFLCAGPILATLDGYGELLSSLRGLGIPESAVACFEGRLRQGDLLLSVQCDDSDWADRARRILHETGAAHVATSGTATQEAAVA